jgi:hypothetical protein
MGCHLSGAQQRDGFAVAAVSGLVVGEQCATTGRHSARPGAPARCGNLGQMVTRGVGARSCWPPGRRRLPARTTRPRREYGWPSSAAFSAAAGPNASNGCSSTPGLLRHRPDGWRVSTSHDVPQRYWLALFATIGPVVIRGGIAGSGEQGGQGSSLRHESKDSGPRTTFDFGTVRDGYQQLVL